MNTTEKITICVVIGDPVVHSLSPKLHTAGYKALGIDSEYAFVGRTVKSEDLSNFIGEIKKMKIHGVSCTLPHKTTIMQYLDHIDDRAKKIGAVNTIVNDSGVLKGYNTDWLGVIKPLEKITSLEGKTVAILGAGGAARATAYAVTNQGAKLTIYNRTLEKAQKLVEEFGGNAFSLDQIDNIKNADIIINTTSLGLHPHENETPLSKDLITSNHIVFDLVYTKHGRTKFLEEAKEKGARTISGIEMLVYQGMEQFKLFTGKDAPEESMRNALMEAIN
jgi:shikimate dehydrogenase